MSHCEGNPARPRLIALPRLPPGPTPPAALVKSTSTASSRSPIVRPCRRRGSSSCRAFAASAAPPTRLTECGAHHRTLWDRRGEDLKGEERSTQTCLSLSGSKSSVPHHGGLSPRIIYPAPSMCTRVFSKHSISDT